ncbi:MAG: DUF2802 domain-containing protein [Pseudomonadales bacterium]|nr:DUF2802 domain-containing protein [Pseudomonadales bacterium]
MNMYNVVSTMTLFQWGCVGLLLALGALSIRHLMVTIRLGKTEKTLELTQHDPANKKLDEVLAMCQSMVGLGQHIQKIERRLNELESNDSGLQTDRGNDTPYRQAAMMLDMGADLNDLVSSLEMSQAEARLFQVLHGDMQNKTTEAG